ncbi:MAG: RluA family pseudouridine synthase [Chloroflexi bacterium]|nr:RluA family pseudouridine synthase [Chloroflexota bacterium]
MVQTHSFVVSPDEIGQRLDRALVARCPDLSRSAVQRRVLAGDVTVNGVPTTKAGRRLEAGELVRLLIPPPVPFPLQPENIPLKVLYQDADLLAVEKPAGMAVHPAPGHATGTLVNALLASVTDLSGIGGELRPGIVHRLDKETSGLLLVAKNDVAHRELARQLKEREMEKTYLALAHGQVSPPRGIIDAPIGRDPRNRKRMAVVAGQRPARTEYRLLVLLQGFSLLEVHPVTGRTHQIRVHLAALGHSLAGDPVYARAQPPDGLERLFLHAHRLAFHHPRTKERIGLVSPLPSELSAVLRSLASDSDPTLLASLEPLLVS